MAPIDADRLMNKNIMNSNFIEQDILSKDNINDAIEYLKNNKVPWIEELYQALFKKEAFRHCSVYVGDKNNSKIISAANVGIQHENIDPNEPQQLVNFAYEYDQPNKIIVIIWLIYELKKPNVQPHSNVNTHNKTMKDLIQIQYKTEGQDKTEKQETQKVTGLMYSQTD
ncbi:MAG: hypothetical protein EZS28_028969 [Streblomastix strix]|uniref:Uncharacterized protein n=1 Tax=Streblomastix strix TaxID=222440 RepID=A0A5J4UZ44_9EUKA|nr:MAG: hypothetical protein EZS28_028969 [Streblomastix strix]